MVKEGEVTEYKGRLSKEYSFLESPELKSAIGNLNSTNIGSYGSIRYNGFMPWGVYPSKIDNGGIGYLDHKNMEPDFPYGLNGYDTELKSSYMGGNIFYSAGKMYLVKMSDTRYAEMDNDDYNDGIFAEELDSMLEQMVLDEY